MLTGGAHGECHECSLVSFLQWEVSTFYLHAHFYHLDVVVVHEQKDVELFVACDQDYVADFGVHGRNDVVVVYVQRGQKYVVFLVLDNQYDVLVCVLHAGLFAVHDLNDVVLFGEFDQNDVLLFDVHDLNDVEFFGEYDQNDVELFGDHDQNYVELFGFQDQNYVVLFGFQDQNYVELFGFQDQNYVELCGFQDQNDIVLFDFHDENDVVFFCEYDQNDIVFLDVHA